MKFPAACRQFLSRLDEFAGGAATSEHVDACPSCADRLAAAQRNALLLGELSAPNLPAEAAEPAFLERVYQRATELDETAASAMGRLEPVAAPLAAQTPAFLDGIYARANEELEADLAPALDAAIKPMRAPADAVWLEAPAAERIEPALRRILTRTRSPGWMWKRIRATVRPAPVASRRASRASWGLVAAALVASAALVIHNPFADPGNQGTNPLIPVVFEARLEPFDASFSMSAFREIGR